ncbi:MAG: class I adenylate-forming enzyme family protein [Candidatus Neomarinimicrobiota bacterium]
MSDQTWKLPLLNSYIEKWADETPDQVALLQHEDGKAITYKKFLTLVDFFALRLQDLGFRKGDRLATMLVLVPEHVILMYACFKLGVIIAPLDVRLKEEEVVRDINKINPRAFFFLGNTPVRDFRSVGRAVQEGCPAVEYLVQFQANPAPGELLAGAIAITDLLKKGRLIWLKLVDLISGRLRKTYAGITANDPALIIFTTGTTGEPKPALLSHENIIVQNEILRRTLDRATGLGNRMRLIINLPPSHVGCVTEQLMTTLYAGGTAIMLRIFDARETLVAIEKHRANCLGQIPTQFRLQWALPDFDQFDLSSLQFVIYGGSAVDVEFLKRLSQMAPKFGTGLGMTENGGFGTFTRSDISVEEMAGQVGEAFPELARVSIRQPLIANGSAGAELPTGEAGEICYHPPLVFLGYFNQPEATAAVVSREGILYTGDLGYFKDMGNYQALYLSGRKKFVIKQKGYNVFPDEVQAHIASHPKVNEVDVVGMPHRIFDEGIFAFVRPKAGVDLKPVEIIDHCTRIASYKRPQHVELWPADESFPLTRVAKVDKLELQERARVIVEELRQRGKWDS